MLQGFCVRGWSSNKDVVQEQEAQRTAARMWHQGGTRIGLCIVGVACGGVRLSWAGCEPGERGLWCVWKMAESRISRSCVVAQNSKLASARIWCSQKIWPTKGQIPGVGMQIDVCYPVLIRPSPICLAFAVSTKPLSPRCGQGSCYPERVAVWNGGWHIRAPGALSLWGSVAMPLWMIGTRGKETGSWTQ